MRAVALQELDQGVILYNVPELEVPP